MNAVDIKDTLQVHVSCLPVSDPSKLSAAPLRKMNWRDTHWLMSPVFSISLVDFCQTHEAVKAEGTLSEGN